MPVYFYILLLLPALHVLTVFNGFLLLKGDRGLRVLVDASSTSLTISLTSLIIGRFFGSRAKQELATSESL